MSKQLGFLMDLDKCLGCRGCAMACQNEKSQGQIPRRKVITLARTPENFFGFLSMACNHCANPACIRECPQGCFKKRRDGIVVHDPLRCISCKTCTGACPFQIPKINPFTNKVEKCDFCFERQDKGLKPACIEACIPQALTLIDLSKPLPETYQKELPGFLNIKLTRPAVRFILPKNRKAYWANF